MPLDECVVFPDGVEFSPFGVDLRRQGHTQAELCARGLLAIFGQSLQSHTSVLTREGVRAGVTGWKEGTH